MKEVEFSVPDKFSATRAEKLIERICRSRGLSLAMKGSLAKFPGSVHWHYKKEGPGTLELTVLPEMRRVWATVQARRRADWIDAELPQLRKAIELEMKKQKIPTTGGSSKRHT